MRFRGLPQSRDAETLPDETALCEERLGVQRHRDALSLVGDEVHLDGLVEHPDRAVQRAVSPDVLPNRLLVGVGPEVGDDIVYLSAVVVVHVIADEHELILVVVVTDDALQAVADLSLEEVRKSIRVDPRQGWGLPPSRKWAVAR